MASLVQKQNLGKFMKHHANPLYCIRASSEQAGAGEVEDCVEHEAKSTRGKKLKPSKAKIVVLNPREAGLFKQRQAPGFFNDHTKPRERLSALEGVEYDLRRGQIARQSQTSDSILQEIESQRRKLLIFKSSVPKEQVVKSIHDLRPSKNSNLISSKRYEQLKSLLEMAYTLPQLKAYANEFYKLKLPKSTTKKAVIKTILQDFWQCEIDESINAGQDLIIERIIDVQTRDIYLLLLTNNGKILHNFARLGATVAVALSENKIIVRATSALVKYVEVSLRKILDNAQREVIPVCEIIRSHTSYDSIPVSPKEIVPLVQKESATYFEKMLEDDSDSYVVTGLGEKRLTNAKVLLLWALNYCPQRSERTRFVSNEDFSAYHRFPFTDVQCLDWIQAKENWYRLQQPVLKNQPPTAALPVNLPEHIIDELYTELLGSANTTAIAKAEHDFKIMSITLGQVLHSENEEKTTFQSKVPGVTKKLLQLPLYEGFDTPDELYSVDQHEYFIQLKFIPRLDGTEKKHIPPLELWFELDDNDRAINTSVRALLHAEDTSVYLQTPQISHDYKINIDRTLEVVKPYDQDPQTWLHDQEGLKNYLLQARLDFGGKEKLASYAQNAKFEPAF